LLLLLLLLYFIVSSGAFIKGVVLPRVGASLNAQLTVADASLSPFSSVALRQLEMRTTGAEPLLTAASVCVRYSLWQILRGTVQVDEVALDTPVLNVVQNADGTSNLDPLWQALTAEQPPAPPSAEPTQLAVRNITLKNGTVRWTTLLPAGAREQYELANVNLSLDQLANSQPTKASLATDLRLDRRQAPAKDALQGRATGTLSFTLGPDLMPQTAQGSVTHEVLKAEGALAELAGHRTVLEGELTPTELKNLALRFFKGNSLLGEVKAAGPLDLQKLEGRLNLEVTSIDRQVLNLAGAPFGFDFGSTKLSSTAQLTLANGATRVGVNGQLKAEAFSLKQGNQTTPPLNLNLAITAEANTQEQRARVDALTLDATQRQKPLLRGTLSRPMTLAWGQTNAAATESAFEFNLSGLDLAEWKALLGDAVAAGTADLRLNLLAQQDGRRLKTDLTGRLQNLTAQVGSNRLDRVDVQLQMASQLDDFQNLNLEQYAFQLSDGGRALARLSGRGKYAAATGDAEFRAEGEASLPELLRKVQMPDLSASAGALKFLATYTQKSQQTNLNGSLTLTNFTGRYGDYQFQTYQAGADYDLEVKGQMLQVRRFAGALRQGTAPGGSFDVGGRLDLARTTGEFRFTALDLNQHGLGPFLAPYLTPNRLLSLALAGQGTAVVDAQGESALKAELKLSNLVVEDPARRLPRSPLSAELNLDGGMRQQLVTLRQCVLKLSPTDRARNELQLTGRFDLAPTNATIAQLVLRGESLDLTPYYDLLVGTPAPATTPTPAPAPAPAVAAAPTEPDPITLPWRQSTFDAKIDRFYLHEVAITNWVMKAEATSQQIALKQLQLNLNGAPVQSQADLDLSVKGWKYDLSLLADRIPLEPLANTFSPATRGQYQGLILANAKVKGAGITGTSLQKSLAGQLGFSFTNANIQLLSKKATRLITPIAALLRVNDISKSPLNWIHGLVNLGNARMDVSSFAAQSAAFEARAQGPIPIADLLGQSPLNLPVRFLLHRSLAQKAGLMPANTPTNVAYVQLPQFVTVKGTLAEPKSDLNEAALAGLLLKSTVGIAETLGVKVDPKGGDALRNLGSLLTGEGLTPRSTNQAATTNRTANTNPPALFNPFDLIPKPKK
jgi:hypothetical protein